MKLEELKRTER